MPEDATEVDPTQLAADGDAVRDGVEPPTAEDRQAYIDRLLSERG